MIFTKRLILDVSSFAYVSAIYTTKASDVYQLEVLAIGFTYFTIFLVTLSTVNIFKFKIFAE